MIIKVIANQIGELSETVSIIENQNSALNLQSFTPYQQVNPAVLWNDGYTFLGANETNSNNNRIIIARYDSSDDSVTINTVGSGTDTSDTNNHPRTFIAVENDFVWCGQTNVHNDPIDVWKSDAINDISAFTQQSDINGSNAYPNYFINLSGNSAFWSRQFNGSDQYDCGVRYSNAGLGGAWSFTRVTDDSGSGKRHYNQNATKYGTPTKHYFIVNHRNNTAGNIYYKHSVLVTSDYETYTDYDGNFSKDVVSASPITDAELEANFVINGSDATDTTTLNYMNGIQVDDDFYGIALKDGTTDYYIFKISNNVLTDTLLNIPNLDETYFYSPFLYYNGANLVCSTLVNNGGNMEKEIWAIDLGLTTFTKKYTYTNTTGSTQQAIILPDNLDQINGKYAVGLKANQTEDTLTLGITSNKFFL